MVAYLDVLDVLECACDVLHRDDGDPQAQTIAGGELGHSEHLRAIELLKKAPFCEGGAHPRPAHLGLRLLLSRFASRARTGSRSRPFRLLCVCTSNASLPLALAFARRERQRENGATSNETVHSGTLRVVFLRRILSCQRYRSVLSVSAAQSPPL
jgi:hypothetical protein